MYQGKPQPVFRDVIESCAFIARSLPVSTWLQLIRWNISSLLAGRETEKLTGSLVVVINYMLERARICDFRFSINLCILAWTLALQPKAEFNWNQ